MHFCQTLREVSTAPSLDPVFQLDIQVGIWNVSIGMALGHCGPKKAQTGTLEEGFQVSSQLTASLT